MTLHFSQGNTQKKYYKRGINELWETFAWITNDSLWKTNIKLSTTFFNKKTVILQANDNLIFFSQDGTLSMKLAQSVDNMETKYLGIYIVYTVNKTKLWENRHI